VFEYEAGIPKQFASNFITSFLSFFVSFFSDPQSVDRFMKTVG